MSNTFTKFIDSCVGAIARKVQDEFDESKHPRDKGGKFSSKGGEGRGGGASELEETDVEKEDNDVGEELIQVKRAAKAARRFKSSGIDLASAMEDLDIPTEGVPEKYLESVFEGSLAEDPKLLREAEDYIERYESGELEKEADRLGSEEDGKESDSEGDDGDAHSAVELGSPEHKNIRQSYMSALTGSVPSLDSTARVKWALDQVDNVMRRFGTESAKNRLMGIVYNVVGLKNSGDKGLVYKQLSDYIKEFE